MQLYNTEQKKEILYEIHQRIDEILKSDDVSSQDKQVIWKNVLFILDKLIYGDFFGKVSIEIRGFRMNDIKEEERTYKMAIEYTEIDEKIEKLS